MKRRPSAGDAGADGARAAREAEIRLASRELAQDLHRIELSVPGVHCAGCIRTVETGLAQIAGVAHARVNLSTKRASVTWRGPQPPDLLVALETLGFAAHIIEPDDGGKDRELSRLVRALAVAGFAAMNIMLLSVSVWSGADATTRIVFHWISAALALPCLIYSGRIFFVSAWSALRRGRTNMDVPISVGVCLAFCLSLYETIQHGQHAYFDAATSLIFFLLIGRTLDHFMRERARSAVQGLARLAPRAATVRRSDGTQHQLPVEQIEPGMRLRLAAGDRVPVDGVVSEGVSDFDCAIATGESAPRRVEAGSSVQAGTLNLSGPVTVVASARADNSFLAEMVRLMEAAEGGRARYRRIADRAAALYSPVVHATALLTFLGWMLASGDWRHSITVAIAVLIITCPCALGLAVPIVQVIAARRLFENGIMVKDGSAIERIAEIDAVAFDKTGTLTLGRPCVVTAAGASERDLALGSRIASLSNHPFARAIAAWHSPADASLTDVTEHPGLGLEARVDGSLYRLGRAEWALTGAKRDLEGGAAFSRDGVLTARFSFADEMRPHAHHAIEILRDAGLRVLILSGDAPGPVGTVAGKLGIDDFSAGLLPAEKVARLRSMAAVDGKVLMVGDGINDAPALAAAHVSMAPASAADIGRNAADFVFLREGLEAVPAAVVISRRAGQLVRQNFALAVAYNAIALPVAIAGYVTPLIAALAMSLSSILVVANALRLKADQSQLRQVERPALGASGIVPEPAE
jgi:Cu2+-exporting ATPase